MNYCEEVEYQMRAADYVLQKLQILDPKCKVAGGAPRDWYLNTPARDIDIYFYSDLTVNAHLQRQLDVVGLDFIQVGKDPSGLLSVCEKESYQRMTGIKSVTDFKFSGENFQLIWMGEKDDVLRQFATPIVQASYDGTFLYHTNKFKEGHELKVLTWINGYDGTGHYAEKIRKRFADYTEL